MHHFQYNIRSLLASITFAAVFLSAIGGAFGERIESVVTDFSLFVTVAFAWAAAHVVFYAIVVSPLLLAWVVAQKLGSRDST